MYRPLNPHSATVRLTIQLGSHGLTLLSLNMTDLLSHTTGGFNPFWEGYFGWCCYSIFLGFLSTFLFYRLQGLQLAANYGLPMGQSLQLAAKKYCHIAHMEGRPSPSVEVLLTTPASHGRLKLRDLQLHKSAHCTKKYIYS